MTHLHLERGPVLTDQLHEYVEHGFVKRMWSALMVNERVKTTNTFFQSKLKVHQQPVRYPEQCVFLTLRPCSCAECGGE
jgi:hypothetical protein